MGEGTGRGDRARARHNSGNNTDTRGVENLQDRFANVRLAGQGGHCPVQGCFYSEAAGHPGLTSTEGLKAHVDAHLIHALDGEVPEEWMRQRGWTVCGECGRSAAASRRGGIHESCAHEARARVQVRDNEFGHIDDGWEEGGWAAKLRSLPTIHDLFTIQGSTREFSHKGLRALYRREFGRLCGRVANYNMEGAWDHMAEPVGRGLLTPWV